MAEKNVGEQQESNELGRMGYAAIRPSLPPLPAACQPSRWHLLWTVSPRLIPLSPPPSLIPIVRYTFRVHLRHSLARVAPPDLVLAADRDVDEVGLGLQPRQREAVRCHGLDRAPPGGARPIIRTRGVFFGRVF